jgi:c-di-GMP-binding flagellar brake protein YcgR
VKPLSQGQHVDLVLDAGSRITARVEDLREDSLVLGLFREPDVRLAGLDATIEFIDHRGIHRLRCRLQSHGPERDAILMLPTGEVELIQRREYVRVDAHAPVDVSFEDRPDVQAIGTTTVNVSASGVLLAGPSILEMGELIGVAIDIGDGEPVRFRCRVVRETQEGFKGCHISEIHQNEQERLIRYVFQRQREAQKARRADA